MEVVLVFLLGLSALASAHYEGYPFEHKNEGRYGADHPYANYGPGEKPQQEQEAYPTVYPSAYPSAYPTAYTGYPYNGFYGHQHNFYGQHPGFYGYNHGAYGHNHEFDYRFFAGHPVHTGQGQFYFLGKFEGQCDDAHDHGLYTADDANSFMVCVYGQSHRFQCPKGTVNAYHRADFEHGHPYTLDNLCGVNTLSA